MVAIEIGGMVAVFIMVVLVGSLVGWVIVGCHRAYLRVRALQREEGIQQ